MNAFVTGSTGLLGSNLVKLLLEQGWRVSALVRSPEKAQKQLGNSPNLTIVKGDMEEIADFAAQMQGSDVLFHVAAYFREYYGAGDHWAMLQKINITGTVTLIDEALKQGVKKVIYVSSSGVIGTRADGKPGDESTLPSEMQEQNLYMKSKVLAEEAIAEWLKTHSLPVVLILPTWMWGPQDAAPTAAGQLALDFLNRGLPAIVPGGSAVVDVRDVAQMMIAAVEKGKSGERYIINNEFWSIGGIASALEKITSVTAPKLYLPYPVALSVAWVSETMARMRGMETLLTVNGIRTMKHGHDVTATKAMRELGFRPRPFVETLRDTIIWYQHNQPEKIKNRAALKSVVASANAGA